MTRPTSTDHEGTDMSKSDALERLKVIEREVTNAANELDQMFRQRHTMSEVERLLKRLINRCEPVSATAPIDVPLALPPEQKKRVGQAIAEEMQKNWQCDDDVIDSFGRVAALAYVLGMNPSSRSESVATPAACPGCWTPRACFHEGCKVERASPSRNKEPQP